MDYRACDRKIFCGPPNRGAKNLQIRHTLFYFFGQFFLMLTNNYSEIGSFNFNFGKDSPADLLLIQIDFGNYFLG